MHVEFSSAGHFNWRRRAINYGYTMQNSTHLIVPQPSSSCLSLPLVSLFIRCWADEQLLCATITRQAYCIRTIRDYTTLPLPPLTNANQMIHQMSAPLLLVTQLGWGLITGRPALPHVPTSTWLSILIGHHRQLVLFTLSPRRIDYLQGTHIRHLLATQRTNTLPRWSSSALP